MKRVLCTAALLFAVTLMVTGQNYTLQVATGNYADLTGSTSLNQNQVWDDPEYPLPLGFSFPLFNSAIHAVTVFDGFIDLGMNEDTIVAPYGVDMIDRGYYAGQGSLSPISYKSESINGVQVMKIEWKNFGFYDEEDMYGTLNWYGNVQFWMYENGIMEVHIGPNSIAEPLVAFYGEPGPYVGFGTMTTFHYLSGPAASPTMTTGDIMSATSLGSVPADGIIYRFLPAGISVPKTDLADAFALYPNPVTNALSLNLPETGSLEVFDLTGKRVMTMTSLPEGKQTIDMSSFNSGIYMVAFITSDGERATRRVVKQ